MKNDFCGGFQVQVSEVQRVCNGVKKLFEEEKLKSKERIDAYLAQIPIFGNLGFSIEKLLKVRLPRLFKDEAVRAQVVSSASDGTVYSSMLSGEYTIQEEIYDIWHKDRLTNDRDLEKASYLLRAIAMVDSEHVYLETKDASWLGRAQRHIQ